MTKKSTISYISDLMSNPGRLTTGDQGSIGGLRQSFPYFVPVRYLDAVASHREAPYSPAMLSAISPYMGNWILFSDFMDASLQLHTNEVSDIAEEHNTAQTEDTDSGTASSINDECSDATENTTWEATSIVTTATENEIADIEPELTTSTDAIATADTVMIDHTTMANEASIHQETVTHPTADATELLATTTSEAATTAELEMSVPESLLPTDTFKEEIPEQQHTVSEETVAAIVQVEPDNNIVEVATTNTADNTSKPTSTDIEEEHNNFWTQSEESDDTSNSEEIKPTDTVVSNPIPEQLPIKKTPAPEPAVQNQIPSEEYKPTQHSRHEKPLIYPIYTEDYFLQQGEKISPVIPSDIDSLKTVETAEQAAKSLMVMMSFTEWLLHFKSSTEKQKEETKDQRALKTMWQKEKLAAAIEEENEEIPENVFEMAVNSITKEDGLASESLADIYIKQGKLDKAIDMYRKLSLRNPQKNAYFARKIEEILKDK